MFIYIIQYKLENNEKPTWKTIRVFDQISMAEEYAKEASHVIQSTHRIIIMTDDFRHKIIMYVENGSVFKYLGGQISAFCSYCNKWLPKSYFRNSEFDYGRTKHKCRGCYKN